MMKMDVVGRKALGGSRTASILLRAASGALILFAGLNLGACADSIVEPIEMDPVAAASTNRHVADHPLADSWMIVFHRGRVADMGAAAEALVKAHGGELRHVYGHALEGFAARLPEAAVRALSRNPNVAYIEQDWYLYPSAIQENAPWSLDRIDQRAQSGDGRYRYWWTGFQTNIYIIDSGMNHYHSEFGNRGLHGYTAINDGRGSGDCLGHGTSVAGAAGGATGGVAKQARLWSVRIDDCVAGAKSSDIVAGIDWVAGNHQKPAVANLSYGGSPPGWWERTFTRTIEDAVRGLVSRGVTLVTAAGNDGINACDASPARMSEAVTVGAVNSSDQRSVWSSTQSSNWGSCLNIWAPGSSVYTAHMNGGMHFSGGTSIASPMTAGVIALLLQEAPGLSVDGVRSRLNSIATSTTIGNAGTGSPHRLLHSLYFTAFVSGPWQITEDATYTWTAHPAGGGGNPVSYVWEYRPTWSSTWQVVGTAQSYSRTVSLSDPDFNLRMTATADGVSLTRTISVEVAPVEPCIQDPTQPWMICPI
jgi:subtilisin family serine protease